MKRKLQIISLLLFLFSIQTKAFCPLTTAVDFTATDTNGQEITLFDILDEGKYVLISFFLTTSAPCEVAAPKIKDAYERLGCNQNEVFFIGVSPADNNETCNDWINEYGIGYPTIGKDGGGADIRTQYVIAYYPTVILIAPDRSIVIQDLYPITDSDFIVNSLAQYGIEEHDCGSSACPPATNVQATADGSNVNVTWNAPVTKKRQDILFSDNFDNGNLDNWTLIDNDGDSFNWKASSTHQLSGEYCASSWSWDSTPFYPDNWMISPIVDGATNIKYYVSVNNDYPDHYAIMASSTGNDINDFTVVFEETVPTVKGINKNTKVSSTENGFKGEPTPWAERKIELPTGTKYVAFRHYESADLNFVFVDDVTILGGVPVNDYTYTVTKNGAEIATGITQTSYTDNNVTEGSYEYCVEVVYADCTSTPACATITGINNEIANRFKVYPNPAIDVINIEGDVANITMYNSLGQVVNTSINNSQIDVRSLENGIYYLNVTGSDRSRRVEKVVIAK